MLPKFSIFSMGWMGPSYTSMVIAKDEILDLVLDSFAGDIKRFPQQKEVKESQRRISRCSEETISRSSKTLDEVKTFQDFVVALLVQKNIVRGERSPLHGCS